jgi:hypothetical protein
VPGQTRGAPVQLLAEFSRFLCVLSERFLPPAVVHGPQQSDQRRGRRRDGLFVDAELDQRGSSASAALEKVSPERGDAVCFGRGATCVGIAVLGQRLLKLCIHCVV